MSKLRSSLPEFCFYVVIFVIGTLIHSSCTKNYYFEAPAHKKHGRGGPLPVVTSFSPLSGPKGTTVTINGANFSTLIADDQVTFNGVVATVISATANTLTVTVPQGAGDGKVSVSTGGPAYTFGADFKFQYTVTTLAGDTAVGNANGAGPAARFSVPYGVVIDTHGDLIVTDAFNDQIRKVTPAGVVSSFNNAVTDLLTPTGITIDAAGNIYVSDADHYRIRKITPQGTASTLAGGVPGYAEGQGANAKFNYVLDLVADAAGNIYVVDVFNQRIRKITPAGVVSTLAGNGTAGYADGPAATAQFFNPTGIAIDAAGNLYVSDGLNYRIRKITPAGIVSTIAGSGIKGYADGPALNAQFDHPTSLKVDGAGNIYLSDSGSSTFRKITPAGMVSTLAGSNQGFANGIGTSARFFAPRGIALDAAGTIYVVDVGNNCIRKLD